MRKSGSKKGLSALPPCELFHVHIINLELVSTLKFFKRERLQFMHRYPMLSFKISFFALFGSLHFFFFCLFVHFFYILLDSNKKKARKIAFNSITTK